MPRRARWSRPARSRLRPSRPRWAATESRPHAWITLTAAHDDPAILSRLLGEPVREPPFVLFLDRLDAVSDRRALELIAGIVAGLAPGSIVATASRAEPRLGLGG